MAESFPLLLSSRLAIVPLRAARSERRFQGAASLVKSLRKHKSLSFGNVWGKSISLIVTDAWTFHEIHSLKVEEKERERRREREREREEESSLMMMRESCVHTWQIVWAIRMPFCLSLLWK